MHESTDERRRHGLQCKGCGSRRCAVTAYHETLIITCRDCASTWGDRRTTRRVGAECAPATSEVRDAVHAICASADNAALVDAALRWTQAFTNAERVSLQAAAVGGCYYRDRDAAVTVATSGARRMIHPPPEPRLLFDTDDIISFADACRPLGAGAIGVVPIRSSAPLGALIAYWRCSREGTRWRLAMMELVADAVAVRQAAAADVALQTG